MESEEKCRKMEAELRSLKDELSSKEKVICRHHVLKMGQMFTSGLRLDIGRLQTRHFGAPRRKNAASKSAQKALGGKDAGRF